MTESRDEMVVRMAAAFPWAEYNREKPVGPRLVAWKFPDETLEPDGLQVVAEVVKLVNERPADPFEGIA